MLLLDIIASNTFSVCLTIGGSIVIMTSPSCENDLTLGMGKEDCSIYSFGVAEMFGQSGM